MNELLLLILKNAFSQYHDFLTFNFSVGPIIQYNTERLHITFQNFYYQSDKHPGKYLCSIYTVLSFSYVHSRVKLSVAAVARLTAPLKWCTGQSRDRDHPGQYGETLSLLKIQKISWARWHMPVVPATREAQAGEFLEPRGRDCSQPRLHHCTPV